MRLGSKFIRELIEKQSMINSFNRKHLQPASYDCTLAVGFSYIEDLHGVPVVLGDETPYISYPTATQYTLKPKEFCLASTVEYVEIPFNVSAEVQGKSSIGRAGLFIHNAGWIDPGFRGQITLELFNASPNPIVLNSGIAICQFTFAYTYGVEFLYNGKYVGQRGTTTSRIHLDKKYPMFK